MTYTNACWRWRRNRYVLEVGNTYTDMILEERPHHSSQGMTKERRIGATLESGESRSNCKDKCFVSGELEHRDLTSHVWTPTHTNGDTKLQYIRTGDHHSTLL